MRRYLPLIFLACGCSEVSPPHAISTKGEIAAGQSNLRALAEKRGLMVGTMVKAQTLVLGDQLFNESVKSEFDLITATCYFANVQKKKGQFDFKDCDAVFNFAGSTGVPIRGHTLIWNRSLPDWLTPLNATSLWTESQKYVSTVVGRYRGRALVWDVVNEAVHPNGGGTGKGVPLRTKSLWYKRLGPAVYDSAFIWARRADPYAGLFYNDWGLEVSAAKAEGIYRFVDGLKSRGIPITGVGLQFHLRINQQIDTARVHRDMKRLAALGLDIHITELDVLIGSSPATPSQLEKQADMYRTVLRLCLDTPRCSALVVWGFTDLYQFRSDVTWADDPLILDRQYGKKPAYGAMVAEIWDRGR